MTEWNTQQLIDADKKFVWHPFTNMRDWCAPDHEPLLLVEGHGAILRDSRGREYIDGNSSIWTNIHGHNHPHINAAIRSQLDRVAHTSFLGFTNPAATELAEAMVDLFPPNSLTRVFYSDDGSTGIEVALRIADQYWRLRNSRKYQFIAFQRGYHGDTAGAAALGAAAMFQIGPTRWNFPAIHVPDLKTLERISATEAAKIRAFFVDPSHARRGIGSLLLEHCEKQARAHGYTEVELMATLPGVRLYAARGYVGGPQVHIDVGSGETIEFIPMRKALEHLGQ